MPTGRHPCICGINSNRDPGEYTVTLTVTDNSGLTAMDMAIVTVTEQSALLMHVAKIDMALNTVKRDTNALATVTIVDAGGFPVVGATVFGKWSGATSDSDSGVTNITGKVTLQSDSVRRPPSGTTFTFTVTNVTLYGWTYDPSANIETSDSIIVP